MKLLVLEQIHVSSVSADTLRRGQEIEVSNSAAAELLKHHPEKFERTSGKKTSKPESAPDPQPENKQAPAAESKPVAPPENKQAAKHEDKSAS